MAHASAELAVRSRSQMKVAVVCPYAVDHFGGVQHQAIQLVDWLREAGHDSKLIAPGRSGGPLGTEHLGSSVNVPGNRSVSPISLNPLVYRQVLEAVDGADVVHVHEPLMPLVGWATLGARPLVATVHASPSRLVRTMYHRAGRGVRKIFRNVDVLTAVSEAAAAPLRLSGLHPRVIPNGIDVASYTRDNRPGTVVFVGRDDPRKGLDVLLDAWPGVLERHPEAVLTVVGTARPTREGVRFLGVVSEDVKRRVLSESSILVAPNLGGESFGIVLAEAMASGCALVASRLDAFAKVAGGAAKFFPPGDSGALANAVAGLLADPKGQRRLTKAADRAVKAFDRSSVLDAYLKAYGDAVEHTGS
ncbi:MAG: glycosyltransferase family 4 protein [Acidimicrobiia bacterium]|nr:glycosyltransferase family 4 protein [Acidimicrobiia bacterium]